MISYRLQAKYLVKNDAYKKRSRLYEDSSFLFYDVNCCVSR